MSRLAKALAADSRRLRVTLSVRPPVCSRTFPRCHHAGGGVDGTVVSGPALYCRGRRSCVQPSFCIPSRQPVITAFLVHLARLNMLEWIVGRDSPAPCQRQRSI